tara:strand:- start:16939 stop:17604 length:666 start_codon:yes stop_codon:yes gene_type:complete
MERKIKILKGRRKTFDLFVQNEQGQPKDLTGWSLIRLSIQHSKGCIKKYAPATSGVDEVQRLDLKLADAGSFKLSFSDEVTPALDHDVLAAQIQTELNNFFELSGISVADVSPGVFDITFGGNDGARAQDLLKIQDNTLSESSNDVIPTVTEETVGVEASGIEVVEVKSGHLKITLSTDDVDLISVGPDQSIDLYVRIGTEDLDLDPALLREVLDVEEIPC